MKKEFVTYEQALKLKELGCDEDCLGYYNIDPYLPNPTFNLIRPFEHEWCLPAPLKQQVFKWFREKYNILSYIDIAFTETFRYNIVLEGGKGTIIGLSGYDTYEEAEGACIDKLLEIVKQQSNDTNLK